MDFDVTRPQRGCGFQPDEARADNNRAARASCGFNNRPAIGERTQHVDMRLVGTQDRQAQRLRTRRQQQTIVGYRFASGNNDTARFGVDRSDVSVEPQLDLGFGVKTVRTQRQPVFRRGAGEIVFR